ncbi:hypothetical protein C8J57DRAFT_1069725 [Mycena rebaudengoi]|nr:hypothetical protein C8J57DRAFT_1069725 [Mycena rebaudengoi]
MHYPIPLILPRVNALSLDCDNDGPKIAGTFYEYLFKECSADPVSPRVPDLSNAAKALHVAVTALYREPGMTFERWVPFVHHGL